MAEQRVMRKPFGTEVLPHPSRGVAWFGAAIFIGIAAGATMVWYDPTAGAVLPVGAVVVGLMIRYPFAAYVITLAQFSIIPIEGHFFGFFVPNLTQLLVPGLVLSIAAQRILRREWGAFRLCVPDVLVLVFLALGYLGIFAIPGQRQFKYFTNQELFPALLYFAARWLDIDRRRFRLLLSALLGSTLFTVTMLVVCATTRWDPVWGEGGRGPIGSHADATAYFAIWPVFFLYAGTLALKEGRKRLAYLWFAGVLLSLFAVTGTHERSGLVAALLGLLICFSRPRLARCLIIGLFLASPVIITWMTTSVWKSLHTRLREPDPALRRRLYRLKAVNYIKSPAWNPWLGTGFGRLADLSVEMIPDTLYVYDPNWQAFRPAKSMVQRAIHCAPLTIYGEYGLLGTACLCLFLMLLIAQSVRLFFGGCNGFRGPPDKDLIVVAWAAAAGLILNGVYHNTDTVVQVLVMCWTFSGLIIGHREVFQLEAGNAQGRHLCVSSSS